MRAVFQLPRHLKQATSLLVTEYYDIDKSELLIGLIKGLITTGLGQSAELGTA